jgi:hypothetical protein
MTTGYVVSGRGDLDVLFKARTSSPTSATGFLSNGGVDLNQRFEPRGTTTAIANTNFVSGSTDLAQIFMDINAATVPPLPNSNFRADAISPNNAICTYNWESDGDIIEEINETGTAGFTDVGDWVSPKSAAPDLFEVRATITSGALAGGSSATGTWLALTSTRFWSVVRSTNGTSSCSLTIEVRHNGGAVLRSCTVTMTAARTIS